MISVVKVQPKFLVRCDTCQFEQTDTKLELTKSGWGYYETYTEGSHGRGYHFQGHDLCPTCFAADTGGDEEVDGASGRLPKRGGVRWWVRASAK
jgi:hypothetical protein